MKQSMVHRLSNLVMATFAFMSVALIVGCAASPEDIKPQHVSDVQYRDWTCEQLSAERQRIVADLSTASARQEETSSGDVFGVFLLGLPLGSITGEDLEPQIAQLKGERDAIDRVAKLNDCVIAPAKFETAPAKVEPEQAATEEQGPSQE
jgi:hypothetical protein